MSSHTVIPSPYRIDQLARALDQTPSVIKLCFKGPKSNVETASIDSIQTIDEAKKMMRKAKLHRMRYQQKPGERERLIAKRWFTLCTSMSDLDGPFSDYGAPDLYYNVELRHIQILKANEFSDRAIESKNLDFMLECWKECPAEFVSDKLLLAMLDQMDSVRFGLAVLDELMKSNLVIASVEWIYLAFVEKMTQMLIHLSDAKRILEVIVKHKKFDHAIPAMAFLVRKMEEDHLTW